MIKSLTIALLLSIFSLSCTAGEPRALGDLIVQNATLTWEYPAELMDSIDHFNIYWSPLADPEPATEINAGKLLTWTIPSMNCEDCRFWVSAVDHDDIESERTPGHDSNGSETSTLVTQTRPQSAGNLEVK